VYARALRDLGDGMIRSLAFGIAMLAFACTAQAAQVKYYATPAGSHPHDVAPAPDGTVWYTGQHAGNVGRLDPSTGKIEIIPLGEGSRPHGVIVGPDGGAWITDGGLNANLRVDPKTKEVKVFRLPEELGNANLNTGTFDRKGIYWFTGQNGVYGRVDPATGKVEAWKAPKGRGPYGITTTPAGEVWYASLAGDHIARVDIVSGEATVVEPPRPGVGPRRIWADSKGLLWVSFWHSGEVARYDPVAKVWKTWQLPNSKSGCYSVYVDEKDRVWLTDFMANAIVRFDPSTEKFESFPSDRRGASVRQMLGRPGEVWGAESGTNRLVVIRD
jgi:virginiamycin B lyase